MPFFVVEYLAAPNGEDHETLPPGVRGLLETRIAARE